MRPRRAQIRAGLGKDFPQGWQFKPEISVKPAGGAGRCHRLPAIVRRSARQGAGSASNPGSADIVADSRGLLDRLIETALRCPNANIEIAGHTDADGDGAANQALSEKRAQAVVDYLVRAGLPGEPLHAGRLWQHASRSPATTPTKARRRTAASISW